MSSCAESPKCLRLPDSSNHGDSTQFDVSRDQSFAVELYVLFYFVDEVSLSGVYIEGIFGNSTCTADQRVNRYGNFAR
jgi:hypothetical protein